MKYILLITIFCHIIGCTSTNKLKSLEPTKVTLTSTTGINGIYINKITGKKYSRDDLWSSLHRSYSIKSNFVKATDSSIIKLEVNNKFLNVSLIDSNQIISSFKIKAKLDGNYLSLKRKLFLLPTPIIGLWRYQKILLSKLDNGNLILKKKYSFGGWFIIIPAESFGTDAEEYLPLFK